MAITSSGSSAGGASALAIDSALMLIDEGDIDYYRRNSRRLADSGYVDPWVDDDGHLHERLTAA